MSEQKIYKPRPVTGFPEWLPEERRIEQQWFDHIRKVFESIRVLLYRDSFG
jgi:histidyl-tRNA synthetase